MNEELNEKLESSELQVSAISTEYRNVIHQKEVGTSHISNVCTSDRVT